MSKPTGQIHEIEHHAADRATTRPVVSGTQGVVSAGHPLVSMAGMRMLLAGGNAFDAVAAAGFAAAVVEPTASYTLCGECVALIHDARTRETLAVSGQGTAPALATVALRSASSSSSPPSAGRSDGSSRPTRSPAVIGRPESPRRGSASTVVTSRRPSAPSPRESAGSCAPPIWPDTGPGSSRRSE